LEGCLEVMLEKNRLIPAAKEYKGRLFIYRNFKLFSNKRKAFAEFVASNHESIAYIQYLYSYFPQKT
jgi:hypothetical protein